MKDKLPNRIRILHVIATTAVGGGIQKYVLELCKGFSGSKIHNDVVHFNWHEEHYKNQSNLDKYFNDCGTKVFSIPNINKNIFKFLHELDNVFSTYASQYDILHIHITGGNAFFVRSFRKYSNKPIIFHLHESELSDNLLHKIRNRIFTNYTVSHSSKLIADTFDTGKNIFKTKDFQVIHASLNFNKNVYDSEKRFKLRNKLCVSDDCFVIGTAGRLNEQKNFAYALRILSSMLEKFNNAKLIIVGDGPEKDSLKQLSQSLNISESVKFLGIRDDLDDLFSAFDCYVCTSYYEAVPLSLLSAQASGLYCYLSDKVSDEAVLTNTFKLSIDEEPEKWANKIIHNGINEDRSFYPELFKPFSREQQNNSLSGVYKSLLLKSS